MSRPQAKDINDARMVALVERLGREQHRGGGNTSGWVCTWDVQAALSDFPPKVVLAKLRTLKRRGILDGCGCGCRGDWHLTDRTKDVRASQRFHGLPTSF